MRAFWIVLLAVVTTVLALTLTWVPSSAAASAVGIYAGTETPANAATTDKSAVELGTQFTVSQPGTITQIRFYENSTNTGTHTGSLWSANGTLLAKTTFGAAKVGWRLAALNPAIHVVPGQTYTASYHTTVGKYSYKAGVFSGGKTIGVSPLITGKLGTYTYGKSAYPSSNYNGNAYYVDALFVADTATTLPTTTVAPTTTVPPTTAPTTTTPPSSGYPNASNTGTTGALTKYTGPLNITVAGTVVQNVEIDGCVSIAASANNVSFRNVLFKSNGCYWLLLNDQGATGATVTDSEFDGLNNTGGDAALAGANFTLTRVNIHGTVDGLKLGSNDTIQDSYIHDLAITSSSHNDGMQSLGSDNVKIHHNTIIVKDGGTSAIILSTGSADSIHNVVIDSNLLGGGAFTVYGGYQSGTDDPSKVGGISITNNKFTTAIFPNSGAYGPLTSDDSPAVTVTGNTWYDGPNAGQAIPAPATSSTSPTATTAPPTGFPTASTTGVPAGTQLTTVNGDLASSSSGQVITNKLITGDFVAGDANVTLKNSRVLGRIVNQSKGLTITDTDIGPSACPSGPSDFNELGGTNYTLTRVHVVGGGADLIGIGGAGTISITDSLIDHACFYSGEHLDAAQFYSPGDEGHVTFTHDSLDVRPVNSTEKGNSAIFWADNPAASSTLTVTNSKLAGGNYTVALYDAGTLKLTGNTFVKGSYNYGACATNVTITFTGNVYDDGTAVSC